MGCGALQRASHQKRKPWDFGPGVFLPSLVIWFFFFFSLFFFDDWFWSYVYEWMKLARTGLSSGRLLAAIVYASEGIVYACCGGACTRRHANAGTCMHV